MRYLLIRPRYKNILANLEPLGLEYVGGVLNDLEKEHLIYDEFSHINLFKKTRLRRIIKSFKPEVVGFTAHVNTVNIINKMACIIKKLNPDIRIIVGGPHAELNYDEFFTPCIDYIFTDSDLSSFYVAAENNFNHDAVTNLTGVCYREKGEWFVNPKSKPARDFNARPDRTHFYENIKKNYLIGKGRYALLKASFSCPYDCNFCYCCKMNQGVHSERSLDDVVKEIKDIANDKIWIVDDTFLTSRKRVEDFITRIKEQGISKEYMAYSRVDFIVQNEDLMPHLYEAGFRDLLVGIETFDKVYLDKYNKRTSEDVSIKAAEILAKNKILCNGLFIVDHCFSKQDFRNMYDFIRMSKIYWCVFAIFTPLKHTNMFDEYKDRLVNYMPERLDFVHLVLKPEKMSTFMFYLRFYWLNVKCYFRLLVCYIFNKEGVRNG